MTEVVAHEGAQARRPNKWALAGWSAAGISALLGAALLWLAYADAVFLERVLAALASCF